MVAVSAKKKKGKGGPVGYVRLVVPAQSAQPGPPIGPALGQRGINLMEFCKSFNALTQNFEKGLMLRVRLAFYSDRSFDFVIQTPASSILIKRACGIKKGSATPHTQKVAKLTFVQLKSIAEQKMTDLNAYDLNAAMCMIRGTARSMGVEIEEEIM